jgi:glycosyltransferase involved in cell wall biosynthesis
VKILHVNKFIYRRGGAEAYMLDLAALQEAAGHQVAFFGMRYPENIPTAYERSFPSKVDFDPPPASLEGKVAGAARLLWSSSAERGMDEVLGRFRPDVVHLHNIYHQLSPSILRPVRRRGVAALMTLHDYKLACPTYRFLDHGRICEACLPRRFWQPALKRCNAGSLAASSLNAIELTIHTYAKAYAPVAIFSCPSRFMLTKMAQGRVFPDRLRHMPNFVDAKAVAPKTVPGGGVVYAGRLSPEKGVDVLIDAVAAESGLRLDVAGDGPSRAELEQLAVSRGAADRVTFHGRLSADDLHALLRGSAVAALPSRWYENMPLAVLDAFAAGLPVVGTSLGGTPELIAPGHDGYIVPPDDPGALGASLASIVSDPNRALAMGAAGREKVLSTYAPDAHLPALEELYSQARERTGAKL